MQKGRPKSKIPAFYRFEQSDRLKTSFLSAMMFATLDLCWRCRKDDKMNAPMTAAVVTGSCLCGAVSFEFELPTLFAGHCHCTMCQRAHGAGFVTWVGVREDGFRITAGVLSAMTRAI